VTTCNFESFEKPAFSVLRIEELFIPQILTASYTYFSKYCILPPPLSLLIFFPINRMKLSRRMRWAGNVARMGGERCAQGSGG
jgi:hypothetical protein